LQDYVSGRSAQKKGRPNAISEQEEKIIVAALIYSAECGWPCDRADLKKLIGEYCHSCDKMVPWSDYPGIRFIRGFEKRWADHITIGKPELLTVANAKSLNHKSVDDFFGKIVKKYDAFDFHNHPERVYNLDETGFNTDEKAKKCFFRRGERNVPYLSPTGGKTCFTVLFCGNASGEILPPFIVYKGMHLYSTWCKGGPDGTTYGVTSSGWMEDLIFSTWLKKVKLHFYFFQ
jgi:hypothetical protein